MTAVFSRHTCICAVIVAIAWMPLAHAQNAANKAAADALFGEGKKLIQSGDTEGACAKFEASLERLPQLGAQLALASCYEKLGKTASAWGQFRVAAVAAGKARDAQRQRLAQERGAALEAKLSKLVIKTEPGYRIDNLSVKRDGEDVALAELGTPVPVDPGEHSVEAAAPGWVAWSTKIAVSEPGVVEVVVPALGKAPVKLEPAASPPQPIAAQDDDDAHHRRRRLAYIVGGSGGGVLVASLVFGGLASSKWSQSKDHCVEHRCDQAGVDAASSARTLGNVATGAFVVGAAALAAGVYLFVTAPDAETAPRTALRVVPALAPTQLGVSLQGGF